MQNNRKFIGIELEMNYYDAAVQRLKHCEAKSSLFVPVVKVPAKQPKHDKTIDKLYAMAKAAD
ncbi:MAG: hypothetical protein LBH00_06220 [Planctomycetaceae bacterium]|nr:hypothetical protein [Planctomycetaceae bacterium]